MCLELTLGTLGRHVKISELDFFVYCMLCYVNENEHFKVPSKPFVGWGARGAVRALTPEVLSQSRPKLDPLLYFGGRQKFEQMWDAFVR